MRPIELIVATFEHDEAKAGEVLKGLRQAEAENVLSLEAVAVLVNPTDGKIQVKDYGDVDAKHGGVFGAITGALIGMLGGPVGVVIGGIAGAATGGVTAKVFDRGVPDRLVKDIRDGLPPGSSAIIIYAEMEWVDRAVSSLEKEGAVVHHETVGEQVMRDYVNSIDDQESS